MPTAETPPLQDNELDLLDFLIVLAENLKLLITGGLLASAIGIALAFVWPPTFSSVSILSPSKLGVSVSGQVLASQIRSADMLERVAQDLAFEPAISNAQRQKKLERLIQVTVGKQDAPLVTLTTLGPNPEQAQKLNAAIWKQVLPHTIPRGTEFTRLQHQLDVERARLSEAEALETSTAKQLHNGAISESTARLYGELLAANSARQRNIAALESQMEGLTEENLAQQPTLPELPTQPKKALIVLGTTAAGGILLLLFIFSRHAWRSASRDPAQAGKISRVRSALGINT